MGCLLWGFSRKLVMLYRQRTLRESWPGHQQRLQIAVILIYAISYGMGPFQYHIISQDLVSFKSAIAPQIICNSTVCSTGCTRPAPKKISRVRITGPLWRKSPDYRWFPSQWTSDVESVFMLWYFNDICVGASWNENLHNKRVLK